MSEETQDAFSWTRYYKATLERPPSPLLSDAVRRFDTPSFAIDLGCGAGVESLELLARGWDEEIRNDMQFLIHWHTFFIVARKPKT